MTDDNKKNLHYFESHTMRGLYATMKQWQEENRKRLLSTQIQQDDGLFCCIALTNPTEVVICDPHNNNRKAEVLDSGQILVREC